ncbi:MBL fold metallo-hydrolase [Ruegeria meonggei]|uniref:MBL fold metallo-hydrolase n=1 Tax=Ruegeria meonggei TaxID=1446476 RepID=UPI00366B28DF
MALLLTLGISKATADELDRRSELKVTWYGVSTLLIENSKTQILVDGYFTRDRFRVIGGRFVPYEIEPDIEIVLSKLKSEKIGKFGCDGDTSTSCKPKTLGLILVAHAHYDHALDAPIVAAATGAKLISVEHSSILAKNNGEVALDNSIGHLVDVYSKAYETVGGLHWESVQVSHISLPNAQATHVEKEGDFRITTFQWPHLFRSLSPAKGGAIRPSELTTLPTPIWNFRQGTPLAFHIDHPAGTMIIFPSAGKDAVFDFKEAKLSADVVLLGIGGVCLWIGCKSVDDLWNTTVRLTEPDHSANVRKVYPIHWDDDRVPLDGETQSDCHVKKRFYAKPSRVIRDFRWFASHADPTVDVIVPTPCEAFYPFQD